MYTIYCIPVYQARRFRNSVFIAISCEIVEHEKRRGSRDGGGMITLVIDYCSSLLIGLRIHLSVGVQ